MYPAMHTLSRLVHVCKSALLRREMDMKQHFSIWVLLCVQVSETVLSRQVTICVMLLGSEEGRWSFISCLFFMCLV